MRDKTRIKLVDDYAMREDISYSQALEILGELLEDAEDAVDFLEVIGFEEDYLFDVRLLVDEQAAPEDPTIH